tara:strand:+ start:147070 stop:148536 length:1467 start_codon:yes stop_codon:yes gene_type:complete
MNKLLKDQTKEHWEYSPALESTDHIQLKEKYDLFINGKFCPSESEKYFETINPANENVIAQVAYASNTDVIKAVHSAKNSYNKYWSKLKPLERGKYIFRIARLIAERAREFAVIETLDGGKPIRESKQVDVPLAVAHFFYYAGWSDKLQFAFHGKMHKPLGVAGQIIPWNFPLLMAAWKIAPALAAGNTVVLKPAETTPLTAMKLAEVIQEADLPPGTVNIIPGDGETGKNLVQNPEINKIAFTGSTEIGKFIQSSLAGSPVKYTLELGGKAANIIFRDAPIDQSVEGIVNSIFFNQGHVCCAGSRLFIQEGIEGEIIDKLKYRMESLILGDPLDKNTDIGAINSKAQFDRIDHYVKIGQDEGGNIFQSSCSIPDKGYWFPPTLFTEVSQSHKIVQEEIFGPVLAIQTFRTPKEVIKKANNTPYGLSGGIWTDKGSKIFKISKEIQAGVVWANTFNKFDPSSPFGGYKESGIGREGGLQGLLPYVNLD